MTFRRTQYYNHNRLKGTDMRFFHVYIHKVYFPRDLWPSHCRFVREDFESWAIQADTRTEAAQRVWDIHGERLLKLMAPRKTKLTRKVSLFVNSPQAGVGGKANRLIPVLVYTGV